MSRAEAGVGWRPCWPAEEPDECLLEFVGRLAGEPWTDHPSCVHPTLGAIGRAVHDYSSKEGRPALRPMAPAFIGTAAIGVETPARLVALCVSTALSSPGAARIAPDERRRLTDARRTARYLLAEHRTDGEEPCLSGAARWWYPVLSRIRLDEPFYRCFVATEQAAEAVAVTARASGPERDARLRQLLRLCIALTPGREGSPRLRLVR